MRLANRMLVFIIRQTSAIASIENIKNLYYRVVGSKFEFGCTMARRISKTSWEIKKK